MITKSFRDIALFSFIIKV